MALIYSSYSQNIQNPLNDLIGEYTAITDFFISKKIKSKVDYKPVYNYTVSELTTDLIENQKKIKVFHFSGHSNQDGLDFQQDDFKKDHFAQFFKILNNSGKQIDCVILNGCSNEAIVQRLANIPVVVGTRTPISNKDAIKFTSDYFKALIEGKNSYLDAFNLSVNALKDGKEKSVIIRDISLTQTTSVKPILNDYFISIQDEKVAAAKFPVGISWKKLLLSSQVLTGLILLVALGLGAFTFQDNIRGYKKLGWKDTSKCNILITNIDNAQLTTLSLTINSNVSINPYLETIYKETFDDIILRSGVIEEHEYSKKLDLDYIMSGNFEEGSLDVQFRPAIETEAELETLEIGTIRSLTAEIKDVENFKDKEQPLIGKFCILCCKTSDSTYACEEAGDAIQAYKDDHGIDDVSQMLDESLAVVYYEKKNFIKASTHFHKAAVYDVNDKALAAREMQSIIEIENKRIEPAYEAYSEYIASIDDRLQKPEDFEMLEPIEKYEQAEQSMRLKRADLVFNHPAKLAYASKQAISDYQYLQRFGNHQKYQSKINTLCAATDVDCNEKNVKFINLKIRSSKNGKPILNGVANYNGQKFLTDNNGVIKIPCTNDKCVGESITIVAKGFSLSTKKIKNTGQTRIVLTPISVLQTRLLIVDEKQKPIRRASVMYNNNNLKTGTDALIKIPCENNRCFGKTANVSARGFQNQKYRLSKNKRSSTGIFKIIMEPIHYPQVGKVVVLGDNLRPLKSAYINYKGKKYFTGQGGLIEIPCNNDECFGKKLTVSAEGYLNTSLELVKFASLKKIELIKKPVDQVVKIKVVDKNRKPLPNPKAAFSGRDIFSGDSKGVILIPCNNNKCINKNIRIAVDGYNFETIKLKKSTGSREVVLSKIIKEIVKVNPIKILAYKDRDKKKGVEPVVNQSVRFRGKYWKTNEHGVINIPCLEKNCLGESIEIRKKDYKLVRQRITDISQEVRMEPIVWAFFSGKVLDEKRNPISQAILIYKSRREEITTRTKTDKGGSYELKSNSKPDHRSTIQIYKDGYIEKKMTVKELQNNQTIILSRAILSSKN